jgi:hypothetical protein
MRACAYVRLSNHFRVAHSQVILEHNPVLRTLIVTHEDCRAHAPREGHQESPQRIVAILDALAVQRGRFRPSDLKLCTDAPMATEAEVTRAHSRDYYNLVRGSGVWRVACGVWCVACGVWRVACGMWRVACGVWRVACGVYAGEWMFRHRGLW